MFNEGFKIKNLNIPNKAIMAPLAGFTDVSFRNLVAEYGAGYTCTEMVSAKGICYGSEKTKELLFTTDNEKIKAVQIFGSEPNFIFNALKHNEFDKFDIIDINMGCPVTKIVRNGEGSMLLTNPDLAYEVIVTAVKAADGRPVTVKIRRGYKNGEDVSLSFAKMAEQAGASAITVHGRYREQFYQGKSDRECIKRIKNSLSIPVIANGDVFSKEDYENILEETNADGVMIARGALGNPGIFLDVQGKDRYRNKKEDIFYYINILEQYYPSELIYKKIKTQLSFFFKGEENSCRNRVRIVSANSLAEIKSIVEDIL